MRLWSKSELLRAVCIEPYQEMVDLRVKEWKAKFGSVQGGKEILSLAGETSADLRLLEKGDVLMCTPTQVHFFCYNCFVFIADFNLFSFAVGCHFSEVATTQECTNTRPLDR